MGPLLTLKVHDAMRAAARAGESTLTCSLDLDRTTTTVEMGAEEWSWRGQRFPYLKTCKDRTVYHWTGAAFEPVARFTATRSHARRRSDPLVCGETLTDIDNCLQFDTCQHPPTVIEH